MIEHYDNFEAASMAVASHRADGRYAEILDEAVGSLWGPAAVGGVRVLVADQPPEEVDEMPSSPVIEYWFRLGRGLMFLVLLAALCILVWSFLSALKAWLVLLCLVAAILFAGLMVLALWVQPLKNWLDAYRQRDVPLSQGPWLFLVLGLVLMGVVFMMTC